MPFKDPPLFALATVMAFISGVVLAGIFGLGVVDSLEQAGILRRESKKKEGIKIDAVTGSVNAPMDYVISDHADKFVTMESQKIGNPHGKATYTGLPLKVILLETGVKPEATKVDIVGSDGYYNTLELSQAMGDKVLLVNVGGEYKLIADGITQEYWVGMIKTIRVY